MPARHRWDPPVFPPPTAPLGAVNVAPRGRAGIYGTDGAFLVWDASYSTKKNKHQVQELPPHALPTQTQPRRWRLGHLFALLRDEEYFPVGCLEPGHLQPLAGLQVCLRFSLFFFTLNLASFHAGSAPMADTGFYRGDTVKNPVVSGAPRVAGAGQSLFIRESSTRLLETGSNSPALGYHRAFPSPRESPRDRPFGVGAGRSTRRAGREGRNV